MIQGNAAYHCHKQRVECQRRASKDQFGVITEEFTDEFTDDQRSYFADYIFEQAKTDDESVRKTSASFNDLIKKVRELDSDIREKSSKAATLAANLKNTRAKLDKSTDV